MSNTSLIRAIDDYIDADVLLEWRYRQDAGVEEQTKRVARARSRLQKQLGLAGPEDAAIIQAAESYLNAHLAARSAPKGHPDYRPVEHARSALVALLREQTPGAHSPASADAVRVIPLTSRIMIALDGSNVSESAVDAGIGLAQALDAHVMLIHVVDPIDIDIAASPSVAEEVREGAAQLLERTLRSLPDSVVADSMLREGTVTAEIVSAARMWDADLIVMGTRGRGRLAQFVLGSTAEGVIRSAPCPVLTVGRESERFVGKNAQSEPVFAGE